MALTNVKFADLITFTRSGATATRVNSAGLIESVAANTPRFDHDPVTLEAKGLLIEEARTNLLLHSEDQSNAAYTIGLVTISANSVVAPDGATTADRIVETTGTGQHQTRQDFTASDSTDYTGTIFAKAGERTRIRVSLQNKSGSLPGAYFDLSTGTKISEISSPIAADISAAGNGWYRIRVTANMATGGGPPRLVVFLVDTGTNISYTGSASSGLYTWGWQVEAGSFPTSYIPTNPSFTSRASTATYFDSAGVLQTAAINEDRNAAYFPVNGVFYGPSVLYEAAATNLLLRSEEFDSASWFKSGATITTNAVAAPDGATTMDSVVEDTSTGGHLAQQTITPASSTTYTFSVFVKQGGRGYVMIQLSGGGATTVAAVLNFSSPSSLVTVTGSPVATSVKDCGDGIYRISISITTASTASLTASIYGNNDGTYAGRSYTGTSTIAFYAWGAQVEAGSYATSYIPTTTATVTRSADVVSASTVTRNADNASITGTAFSDWFNASEGTIYTEFIPRLSEASFRRAFSLNDGTTNEEIYVGVFSGGAFGFNITGGAANATASLGVYSAGEPQKAAFAYSASDFAGSLNGAAVVTAAAAALPTLDSATLGGDGTFAASGTLNGHIKDIRFYPSRLSNTELQDLTS